jgi:hypothetical protein
MPSQGFDSSYRGSNAPGAFAHFPASAFGAGFSLTAPTVAYNAGAGSLAMGNAFVKLTWITKEGESLPSVEGTVAVAAGTGAVTVTIPTAPAGVIGFRVYSAGTTALEELNTSALSTTQVQQNFVTNQGTLLGFPIADTTVQILIYGTGAAVAVVDNSGIQAAFPAVAPSSTSIYDFVVPNTSSQWKVQKVVDFSRPDGTQETAGISISQVDCISPVYPGVNTAVAAGAFTVLNGYLFKATTGGTTATTFIGFSKFNTTKGATTTDGSVVWTSFGKAVLLRAVFSNATTTPAGGATPVAQVYDFLQF